MKFEGTIVITDPCYIIKDEDWSYPEDINYEDLGFSNCISESTIFGDWSCTTYSTDRSDVVTQLGEITNLLKAKYNAIKEYGEGSIQVEVYSSKISEIYKNLEEVGSFCADAGMVGVFLLDEVLKYNPEFQEYIDNRPWCVTVISDFDGEVDYLAGDYEDARIIGKGNVNFFTIQTGL